MLALAGGTVDATLSMLALAGRGDDAASSDGSNARADTRAASLTFVLNARVEPATAEVLNLPALSRLGVVATTTAPAAASVVDSLTPTSEGLVAFLLRDDASGLEAAALPVAAALAVEATWTPCGTAGL